jgi:hypothetical protein
MMFRISVFWIRQKPIMMDDNDAPEQFFGENDEYKSNTPISSPAGSVPVHTAAVIAACPAGNGSEWPGGFDHYQHGHPG